MVSICSFHNWQAIVYISTIWPDQNLFLHYKFIFVLTALMFYTIDFYTLYIEEIHNIFVIDVFRKRDCEVMMYGILAWSSDALSLIGRPEIQ
jgi:hypothetical protein